MIQFLSINDLTFFLFLSCSLCILIYTLVNSFIDSGVISKPESQRSEEQRKTIFGFSGGDDDDDDDDD